MQTNNNADGGLVIFASSVSVIGGTFEATRNSVGVRLESASSLLFFNLTATLHHNTAQGILVFEGSSFLLQNSTVGATNNATGLRVMSKANVSLSGGFGGGNRTVVTLENNSGPGLSLAGASQFDTSTDPTQDDITLFIRNNGGSDVSVDDASVTLQNPDGTNVLGNVVLTFGTRATLNGNKFGRITCERTVLLRGDTGVVCPAPS